MNSNSNLRIEQADVYNFEDIIEGIPHKKRADSYVSVSWWSLTRVENAKVALVAD